ncbi:MAG TPA: hypothetical protein VJ792_06745 [Candidatus Nitrosotalea sp.]|nr:hypothetical protein [Candidatus Nitrosotalea sp.]
MKSRRGLSTVVGTVFSIIALTTTVAYISYSMNTLNQYNNTVLSQNQQLGNTASERFQIGNVAVTNNKLNITLLNTGSVPLNFTKIWVQNTSATNWIEGYVPAPPNDFVPVGGTLKNLGQTLPVIINPANSYNIKLVTSRGTTQGFTMNSPSSSPLNVQFMFLPDTVPSGFKTKLVMIVTNNSTGTLTDVTPSALPTPTYTGSGTTSCAAGAVSPARYNTLAPGSTAIFTWDVTVSGYGSDTCTFTVTQPLQNGYMQILQATATVTVVQLSDSNYAQNAGVISDTYTSFLWTQGGSWNTDWSFPNSKTTDFSITVTNNNQTGGGYKLWLSKNTQFLLVNTYIPNNNKMIGTPYFLVNSTSTNPLLIWSYTDYSYGIPNQGGTAILNFGAISAGSNTQQSYQLPAGTYFGFVLIYGKFAVHPTDPGGMYAQAIPFMAVVAS